MPAAAQPTLTFNMVLVALFGLGILVAVVSAWSWAVVCWSLGKPLLPRAVWRLAPWGFWSVLLVVALRFLAEVGALLVYLPFLPGGLARAREHKLGPADQMTLVGIVNAALLVLVPLVLRWTSDARLADLGLPGRPALLNVFRGAVVCFLLLPGVYLVMFLATRIWTPNQHPAALTIFKDPSVRTAIVTYLSGVLLAPAAEELLFRGVLLGWLIRLWSRLSHPPEPAGPEPVLVIEPGGFEEVTATEIGTAAFQPENFPPAEFAAPASQELPPDWTPEGVGPEVAPPSLIARWMPNIFTSLLFAGVHFPQWPAPVPLFILSLALGVLYRRTGSLLAPIAMHAIFNGLSMTGLFLATLAGVAPKGEDPPLPPPAVRAPAEVEVEVRKIPATAAEIDLGSHTRLR